MSQKVTWLLPVKNGMPYLPEALASIEAQTYANWEVLAWDNGSTDGSVEELERWIPGRLPGRIVTGRPLYVGGALREMVNLSTTDLCARIDADDINLPERLEKQVAFLEAHPETAVLGTQVQRIDAQGAELKPMAPLPRTHDEIVLRMLFGHALWHPTALIRRSAVLEAGNYCNEPFIEDYSLWLRMAVRYRLANLAETLLHYRIHDSSVTQLLIQEGRIETVKHEAFLNYAPLLYGCTVEDAELLEERRHPRTLPVLVGIARHLRKRQGGGLRRRLLCSAFSDAYTTLSGSSHPAIWLAGVLAGRHPFPQKVVKHLQYRGRQLRRAYKKVVR